LFEGFDLHANTANMKYPILLRLLPGLCFLYLILPSAGIAQTVVELDMMSQDDKPLVSARINGQNAYFLVDTGSDISLLFAEFQDSFGFHTNEGAPAGLRSITGVQGRSVALQRTYNARVEAEGCFFPIRFPALEGGRYLEVVKENSELRIVGIIGVDLMKQLKVQIDYSRNKVALVFPDRVCKTSQSDTKVYGDR
jgi:hypothetical protein